MEVLLLPRVAAMVPELMPIKVFDAPSARLMCWSCSALFEAPARFRLLPEEGNMP